MSKGKGKSKRPSKGLRSSSKKKGERTKYYIGGGRF